VGENRGVAQGGGKSGMGEGGRGKAEEWWTLHFKNVLTRDGIELLNNMSYRASLLNFLLYVFHFVIPVLA
jgi:hypothetical protein